MLSNRTRIISLCSFFLAISGCSDSNYDASMQPSPTPEPSIDYAVSGTATKGIIAGAQVSVRDADGNAIAGASGTTDESGSYSVNFSTDEQVQLPLLIVVDGSGATSVCDVEPICEVGTDASGDSVTVGFGESYDLPDDFQLRGVVQTVDESGDDSFTATAYVSPLSEFVAASALSMGDGQTLTDENVDAANERIGQFLADTFPSLAVPTDVSISSVPLIDLTNLAGVDESELSEMSVAATVVSAAVAGLVENGSSTRGDIAGVMSELVDEVNAGSTALFETHDAALIRDSALSAMNSAATRLETLSTDGTVVLPEDFSTDGIRVLVDNGVQALPEIVDLWTTLTPEQQAAPVDSEARGWSDLVFLRETGEAKVSLETTGIEGVQAHLHEGYAGQNGPILVELERDPGNPDRWQLPEDTVLTEEQIAKVLAGKTYFNVHSEKYPAGELRGQVLPQNVRVVLATPIGLQQVPVPVESDGFARAAVTLNVDSNVAQAHLTTSAIEVAAAHIHSGIAGTNGGVVVPLNQDPDSLNHWSATDVDFTDLLDDFMNARLYFNVHTAEHMAGELRGQIVPETHAVRISRLDSAQVVADQTVSSDATGVVATTYAPASRAFEMHMNTSGIVDPLSVELANGAAGVNGTKLYDFARDELNGDHWVLDGQIFTEEQLGQMIDGELYVVVKTAAWPDGEIRGQLTDASVIVDSDDDGVPDSEDAFPNDPAESVDSDGDGVGDNADAFPDDATESVDSDGDGVGDNADAFPDNAAETTDSDGDGTGDNADQCPNDASGTVDSDGDGICDSSEAPVDSDGDGVPDDEDAFPQDSSEDTDSDGDGVGDNADAFPNDAGETADTDGDGVGDNADAFPNDASETEDSDGDGVGDNADAFPTDASETTDTDGDGIGDNADNCPSTANADQADTDGDGTGDACDEAAAATFTEVQSIFNANCVICHGVSGGLSLASPGSYGNLVNTPSSEIPSLDRVEPGDPDNSYIIWKLEGRSGIVGSRMPLGGVLPTNEIELIRSWIEAGAPNN